MILILTISCTKQLVLRKNNTETDSKKLIQFIKNNDNSFHTYSIKYAGRFDNDLKKLKFSGLLRIVKDERIWLSISPGLGIEAARLLLTPDNIKFINRKDKSYFISDYGFFKDKYNIDLTYDLIEKILTNRFVIFDENNMGEESILETDNGLYELKYSEKNNMEQAYIIHPELKKLTKIIFKNVELNSQLIISFSDYIDIESKKIPQQILFNLNKDSSDVVVDFHYKKLTVDKNFKTPFRIPSKFKQICP